MIQTLVSTVAAFAVFFSAYGLGRPLVRTLGLETDDGTSVLVWSTSLGLVVGGTILGLLGLFGKLDPIHLAVFTLAASFNAIWQIVRDQLEAYQALWMGQADDARENAAHAEPGGAARSILVYAIVLVAVAAMGSFIGAAAPTTAGDALCYHLELPKTFLAARGLVYLPYQDNCTFPLLAQMWYLWALSLDGPVAANLVHWGVGALLAAAAVLLARPVLGRSWAWLVGAVVLLTPGVTNQMTAPLNDLALALLTTLAAIAWWHAVVNQEGRSWGIAAGLMLGGALATKLIAVFFLAALAGVSAWVFVKCPRRRRVVLRAAAWMLLLGASVSGMWYARAAWYRGNPVYPFASAVFGGSDTAAKETLPAEKSAVPKTLLGFIRSPWEITMRPESFGGRGHQLGVLWMLFLPGLYFSRRLRGLGVLLGIGICYYGVWFLSRQNERFLFPVIPFAAVGIVWVYMEMGRLPSVPRWIGKGAFWGFLTLFAVVAAERTADSVAVATGWESREDYLRRAEPSCAAAEVANIVFGSDGHVLSQDFRAFYFNSRVTQESVFRRLTRYDREVRTAAELRDRLMAAGFTHVLLAENQTDRGIQFDPTLRRLLEQDAGLATETLVDYALPPDADGAVRRYRLIALECQ